MTRLITVAALAALAALCAQASEIPKETRTDVRIPVVVETKSAFLTSFNQLSFRIYEEGKDTPYVPSRIEPVGRPRHALILAEFSRQLPNTRYVHGVYENPYYRTITEIIFTIYGIVEALEPDDAVALATYDRAVRPVTQNSRGKLDFTRNKPQIISWLESRITAGYSISPAMALPAPYTALMDALQGTNEHAGLEGIEANAAIVLISGGSRQFEQRHNWDCVLQAARNAGVPIYTVLVGHSAYMADQMYGANTDIARDNHYEYRTGRAWLSRLARDSGGAFFFTRGDRSGIDIGRQIAERMAHTHFLHYNSSLQPPPKKTKFWKLRIELRNMAGGKLTRYYDRIEEKDVKIVIEQHRRGIELGERKQK